MSFDVVRRSRMRSILQITLDRSQADTLAEELAQSRRVGRLLQPALRGLPLGIDLTDPGVLRRRDGFVTIYVHSAGQSAKLRQLVPRMEKVLAQEGLRDQIVVKILPKETLAERPFSSATGPARKGSQAGAEAIERDAAAMPDSPLKEALLALAKTLRVG